MRFRRRSPEPPASVPQQEQEVAVFQAEAQRLLEYHWRRADAFERKALGVLAFTGVIVALLTPNLKIVLDLHGTTRTVALVLGGLAMLSLAGSAACSAGALWARDSKSVNLDHVRTKWVAYLDRIENGGGHSDAWHTSELRVGLTEMLLHGSVTGESPVQSLCADADRRGAWFVWGVRLNLSALLFILAVTVTTTWGNF